MTFSSLDDAIGKIRVDAPPPFHAIKQRARRRRAVRAGVLATAVVSSMGIAILSFTAPTSGTTLAVAAGELVSLEEPDRVDAVAADAYTFRMPDGPDDSVAGDPVDVGAATVTGGISFPVAGQRETLLVLFLDTAQSVTISQQTGEVLVDAGQLSTGGSVLRFPTTADQGRFVLTVGEVRSSVLQTSIACAGAEAFVTPSDDGSTNGAVDESDIENVPPLELSVDCDD